MLTTTDPDAAFASLGSADCLLLGSAFDGHERTRTVFERGFTTNQAGTGFGLAIVERVVGAQGWRIDVAESAADGACFEVSFDS